MMATHNLTLKTWGHDYTFRPIANGLKGSMNVWTPKWLYEGDYLIIRNGNGTTRYRIDAAKWHHDPGDMWSLTVSFAPREDGMGAEQI